MTTNHKSKLVRACFASALGLAAWATGLPAFAEWTGQRIVAGLEVATQPSPGSSSYYFRAANGWGAPSCPNAEWAYILNNRDGAKETLAVLMQAKQAGSTVW